jgi:hypothetical protein
MSYLRGMDVANTTTLSERSEELEGGGHSMKLFSPYCDYIIADATEPSIDTPLGKIFTTLAVEETSIGAFENCSYFLESGARIIAFEHYDFIAELLICRPKMFLPEGLLINDCWAFLWRLKAINIITLPSFNVHWSDNHTWINTDIESGEHLNAISFFNNETKVTIGTQDEEVLMARAKLNELMPNKFDSNIEPVEYLKDGLRVSIPSLDPKDICQIQFLIAWEENLETNVGAWYAVDNLPEHILENAGVK